MNICLFEDKQTNLFAPLTSTRGVFDLRVGSTTIAGLAKRLFPGASLFLHVRESLGPAMGAAYDALTNHLPDGLGVLLLNSRWVPESGHFASVLKKAAAGPTATLFLSGNDVVAAWMPDADGSVLQTGAITRGTFDDIPMKVEQPDVSLLSSIWDILDRLPSQLAADFRAYSGGYNVFERTGADIHDSTILINGEQIFVGSGARIRPGVILNAQEGPIIIESDATVFERAVIRGPVFIGRNAKVHVGANIHNVAVGDSSKVGGELHDVILHSYVNKAHDGFLGNAYLGQWCNLGAGTNNSNLRNDYGKVTAYRYETDTYESTDRQFAGLLMGDHSKCSIGTMFNTGTSIGVGCNLFGAGFHPRMVPSFCWGGEGRYSTYRFEKAVHVAAIVFERRGLRFGEIERAVLKKVFDESENRRASFLSSLT